MSENCPDEQRSPAAAPAPSAERLRGGGLWRVALSAGAVLGLVAASECLFFATKPSVLLGLSWTERVGAPLRLVLASALAGIAALLPFVLLASLAPSASRYASAIGRVLPATAVAVLVMLLVDNFTITLFGFGIPNAGGAVRIAYAAAFVGLLARIWWRLPGASIPRSPAGARKAVVLLGLVSAAGLVALVALSEAGGEPPRLAAPVRASGPLPNVVLLGADGLDASRTSLHGYARDTTPFLRELSESSVVFERAFSNSGQTTGSLTSLLTGKHPATTRVQYPPDVLRGRDAFEHLPGILRRNGYRCFDAGVRGYADPLELRILGGFDVVAGTTVAMLEPGPRVRAVLGESGSHLLALSWARIAERLAHIFLGRRMPDPFAQVTSGLSSQESDTERASRLLEFSRSTSEPFFAHVHFLGTHGPTFHPAKRTFSAGKEQDRAFHPDFLDDATLEFDQRVRDFLADLRERGLLDRTLVVVYSDHGREYRVHAPVPLLFRLPGGQRRERVPGTVQLVDVAPTILEVAGIPVPEWMEGVPLLRTAPGPCRYVLSTSLGGRLVEQPDGSTRVEFSPPWFSLGRLELLGPGARWVLDAAHSREVRPGEMDPSVAAPSDGGARCCPPSIEEAAAVFAAALRRGGYPVRHVDPGFSRGEAARIAACLSGATSAARGPSGFPDVPASHPLHVAIEAAVASGLMDGLPGGRFGPDEPLSREEAAVVAGRLRLGAHNRGEPATGAVFRDVGRDRPGAAWIELLEKERGGTGCAAGRFCPDDPVSPATFRDWSARR